MRLEIKALLKKCSTYLHQDTDYAYNKYIDVSYIELEDNGKIKIIAGMAEDLETYHCWNDEHVQILEINGILF